jgi:hypothetical protein
MKIDVIKTGYYSVSTDKSGRKSFTLVDPDAPKELRISDIRFGDILANVYRNFKGAMRKSKDGRIVNAEGARNFCLRIPDEWLPLMEQIGVGITEQQSEDEMPPLRFVKVKVNFKCDPSRAPKILVVDGTADDSPASIHGPKELDSGILDSAQIVGGVIYLSISRGEVMGRPYTSLYLAGDAKVDGRIEERINVFIKEPQRVDPYTANYVKMYTSLLQAGVIEPEPEVSDDEDAPF